MQARFGCLVLLALVFALLGCGCSAGGDEPNPVGTPERSAASNTAEVARTSEQVDIGGRSLLLECWGERAAEESTVLLIAGQGPTTSSWAPLATAFAAGGHHVCAYDRAGVGGSDAAPEATRTLADQVTDLEALLDAATLQEPVILAAHSLGSLPVVGLVARAPERVAGVVLLAPWSPRVTAIQQAALPPEQPDESPAVAKERDDLDRVLDPAQNSEHLSVTASDAEAAGLLDQPGPIFGDIPVIVLREPLPPPLAGLPDSYHTAMLAAYTAGAEEFADESTRGILIEVEDTGHNIQDDQPDIVMDAIRDVMAG